MPRVSATLTTKVAALIFLTSSDRRSCFSMQQLGLNWQASYQPGNLLRLWLLDLEPIGILRTNTPNIYKGFDVSFSRSSETVPPPDHKITIRRTWKRSLSASSSDCNLRCQV